MRKAIVIGIMSLGLVSNRAAAQTAVEQAQILRDFQARVATFAEPQSAFPLFPEAVHRTEPQPKIFTLPVAMVFRQLIAHAWAVDPTAEAVSHALPALPAVLDYQLRDQDLVIHDRATGVDVAILHDAFAVATLTRR